MIFLPMLCFLVGALRGHLHVLIVLSSQIPNGYKKMVNTVIWVIISGYQNIIIYGFKSFILMVLKNYVQHLKP